MAEVKPETTVVNARIVFWGIEGSGKTANLQAIHAKLRPDHRGEMREVPTPFDPTVSYEELPIALGEIAGVRTQIQLVTIPGGPEQRATRKRILDEVDGIVLVIDAQSDRIEANIACIDELRMLLADYGRTLDDMPFVVQYNKRDLADPYFLDELHRRLDFGGAAVFETVATKTTGVLQTLSTISKRVIRAMRERGFAEKPEPGPVAGPPLEPPTVLERPAAPQTDERPTPPAISPEQRMEAAILGEHRHPEREPIEATAERAEMLLDTSWERVSAEVGGSSGVRIGADLSIVSVGEATRASERSLRVPLVLGDGDGNTSTIVLTIQIDALTDGG
jgi:signal recognition particle receptor subunit beta